LLGCGWRPQGLTCFNPMFIVMWSTVPRMLSPLVLTCFNPMFIVYCSASTVPRLLFRVLTCLLFR
ncbi:hypothetical protein L9F63_000803, partial [Diploptera punctata]